MSHSSTILFLALLQLCCWAEAFCPSFAFHLRHPTYPCSTSVTTTTTSLQAATKYILRYEYVPDILQKRDPFRAEHLALAEQTAEKGGPFGTVATAAAGAYFIFASQANAQAFVDGDPYVSNGLVTKTEIVEWTVVVGE